MKTLNLGIVAHVDAGKTSLTEALLHAAGLIDHVGRVDLGTTHTDSLALERQRGITIRAAVVSFTVGDVQINLIDTPGHPDFIAEVDRSLSVLDGAVLVVSAVEGVQPQTLVLMRALRRLKVPTLIFLNKIDRLGADPSRVVATIRERLTPNIVELGVSSRVGSSEASYQPYQDSDPRFATALLDVLADQDDALLAAFVNGPDTAVTAAALRSALSSQSASGRVHPVLAGSAVTGAGVRELMWSLGLLLPALEGDADAQLSGTVFKVERGAAGERQAFLRLFTGTISVRDRVTVGQGAAATVTGLKVFEDGVLLSVDTARAGQIAVLLGLRDVRVGDSVGDLRAGAPSNFGPPLLETGVVASDPRQQSALHSALAQLAETDPLINLRQDDQRGELYVSVFGEVQKEVIEYSLVTDYGIQVEYRTTTVICVERPTGSGSAIDLMGDPDNPFLAAVGIAVEPGRIGSGITVELTAALNTIPLFVYKSVDAFHDAIAEYVLDTLQQGLSGWPVEDIVVTLTDSDYNAPGTKASDFRKLVPLVLMAALKRAGTVVCEPIQRFRLDGPADTLAPALQLLAQHRGIPDPPVIVGRWMTVEGDLPAAEVRHVQRQLPGRTHGEGAMELSLDRYEPVSGPAPTRPRTDSNPLNRKEYLLHVVRRV